MRTWGFGIALLLLVACGWAGDSAEPPDLSDAMKSSATGGSTATEGSHSSHSHGSSDYDFDDGDSFFGDVAGAMVFGMFQVLHGAEYDGETYGLQLPFDAGYVVPFGSDITGITRFSMLPLSTERELCLFGIYLNGGLVDLERGTLPDAATTSASTLGSGLTLRYYFSGTDKVVNPYLTGQAGWAGLDWTYRNPITTPGGKTISEDGLGAAETYAGFGITIGRERAVSGYVEAGFGGMFFFDETQRGFRNDVFDNLGYFGVKAGVSFKF